MTYHQIVNMGNTTEATSGSGTAYFFVYLSSNPIAFQVRIAQSFYFSFLSSCPFFLFQVHCLFLVISSLVSATFPCTLRAV